MKGGPLLLAALLVACGGDDADARCVAGATMACELPDGRRGLRACGPDFRWPSRCGDAPDGGVDAVTPPDIPWLGDGVPPIAPPALTPCPDGWREVAPEHDGDPPTCDPYPESGALDCRDGQAHFPGEPGCIAVGASCPSGDFSDSLPSDRRVIYVRVGATMGDGTATRPYGSLTEFALGGLPAGTVIALSRGAHAGPILLARDYQLVGACAEATQLSTPIPSVTEGVVTFVAAGGSVRDLTLSTSPRPGVWLEGAGVVGRVESTVITGMEPVAVAAYRGVELSMRSVVVGQTAGRGLAVELGAMVEVSRAVFSRNRDVSVFAIGPGTALSVSDVVVRDTDQAVDGLAGRGLHAEGDVTAEVSRALFSMNRDLGVAAHGADGTLRLTDVVVHDTLGRASDGLFGGGLGVAAGATAEVSRALVRGSREYGVFTGEPATVLRASDLVVHDTGGRTSDGLSGHGLVVQLGASAGVTRAHIRGNRGVAVVVHGENTALVLSDAVVRETDGQASDRTLGRGLNVQQQAQTEVSRALFSANHDTGIYAGGGDTSLVLSDVMVRDTLGQVSNGLFGRGMGIESGAVVTASRAVVSSNHEVGVLASGAETVVRLVDVVIRDTQGRESDGFLGRALGVQYGARAELSRAVVSDNHEFGVIALDRAGAVLADVVISNTLTQSCAETTCAAAAAGHGVGGYLPGTVVQMMRFVVHGSELCGVHLAADASVDLERGEVSDNAIGACVQIDDYDLARLMNLVRFVDNEINLDSTSLPVPEAAEALPALQR